MSDEGENRVIRCQASVENLKRLLRTGQIKPDIKYNVSLDSRVYLNNEGFETEGDKIIEGLQARGRLGLYCIIEEA